MIGTVARDFDRPFQMGRFLQVPDTLDALRGRTRAKAAWPGQGRPAGAWNAFSCRALPALVDRRICHKRITLRRRSTTGTLVRQPFSTLSNRNYLCVRGVIFHCWPTCFCITRLIGGWRRTFLRFLLRGTPMTPSCTAEREAGQMIRTAIAKRLLGG